MRIKCPRCDSKKFTTTNYISYVDLYDGRGSFIKTVETGEKEFENGLWCAKCGAPAIVEEGEIGGEPLESR